MLDSALWRGFAACATATLVLPCAPAFAAEAAADAASEPEFSLSGEAILLSDYRFRGLSWSGKHPAVQAGLTAEHSSGLYGGIFSSTIAEEDGGAELDLFIGYQADLGHEVMLDATLTHFVYPHVSGWDYSEAVVAASRTWGNATPKIGIAYAPAQAALEDDFGRKRDNLYVFAGVDYSVPGTPLTLSAETGHEDGSLDYTVEGGKWDWQVGATLEASAFELGVYYVDSDAYVLNGDGEDLAEAALVGSLRLQF